MSFRDEGIEKHDDYEVAEDKIFKAVENAEKKVLSVAHKAEKAVEHAIEDEVKAMFPNQHEDSYCACILACGTSRWPETV